MDRRSLLRGLLSVGVGAGSFAVGAAPLFSWDAPGEGIFPPWVERLAAARIAPWETGDLSDLAPIRAFNPEYDLMSRTFLALALGDLALALPGRWSERAVAALDAMIMDTDRTLERHGQDAFLMAYGRGMNDPSLFVDGERLIVMAIRRLLREDPELAARSRTLGGSIAERMDSTSSRSWPSYPEECWTFCNTLALAALRALTVLDGTSYDALAARFISACRSKLIDASGLLISAYTPDGRVIEGPEGSSIWASIHFLRTIDAGFADEQYALARRQLGRAWLGFGFGREWIAGGPMDVDSGVVVPFVGASPSSSGLAFLAARSAGDVRFFRALHASLAVFGLPRDREGLRDYRTSNPVGDTVLLAGNTAGPLWERLGSFAPAVIAQAGGRS